MTLNYPMNEQEAKALYEKERTSNNPCKCPVCIDEGPEDQVKCYGCEYRHPFSTLVMLHGICGVEPYCEGCFISLKTATYHCPGCGGTTRQGYGYPYWEFEEDADGKRVLSCGHPLSNERCQGWCDVKIYD